MKLKIKTAMWVIKWWLLLLAIFWSTALAGAWLGMRAASKLLGQ
ncbi:hypothetical protein [Neisseria montereyensis]|uniref:DUF2474 domain-containing protein n=1 Tax=Neisseria montereyensis TaxID=2973938 RepID=A0ABT2FE94_9NEIS|nr:hypothetical protein [Neisseria montereyensis]MCS4534275.1 hypothetical protein [Neisseria montereyensis]